MLKKLWIRNVGRFGVGYPLTHCASFSTKHMKAKPHINIGSIGDESHGKTTVVRAILHTLNNNASLHESEHDFNALNKDKLSQLETTGSSKALNFEFETTSRHYLISDNTGNKDHIGNMIIGSSLLEGVILVISAVDGIHNVAKQHLLILQHLQVPNIIVYFNKVDDEQYDEELQELIELEVEELLQTYGFSRDKVPFIRGSALKALKENDCDSIIQLLSALDAMGVAGDDATSSEAEDVPFLLPIQIIHNIKGVGIAVIGQAIQGILKQEDSVELIGGQPFPTAHRNKKLMQNKSVNIDANVASLRLFDHHVKSGKTRDYLGIALHGNEINVKNVKRGMFVVKQSKKGSNGNNIIKAYWKFKCEIEFFESDSNACNTGKGAEDFIGRSTPISEGFKPVFHFITTDCTGCIEEIPAEKNGVIMPGESVKDVTVSLQQSAVLWKDLRFIVREANNTIGVGVITQPIDL